jgi:hypothetical protein
MLNFYVRPARSTDVSAICTLMLAGSDEAVGSEGTIDEVDNWRNSVANTNVVTRRMQEPNMKIMVAENNALNVQSGLLGTGYATVNDIGEGHIGGLFVSLKDRSIEHKIMNELTSWLKTQRAHTVSMSISHANLTLKNLAEEFGLKMTGKESGAYFLNGNFETWSVNINDIKLYNFSNPDM